MKRSILLLAQSEAQFRQFSPNFSQTTDWPFAFVHCRDRNDVIRELHADKGTSIALIILDLGFEGHEGLAALQWLADLFEHIPVLVVCSIADEAKALHAMEMGAQDYLVDSELEFSVLNKTIQCILIRAVWRQGMIGQQEQARVTLAAIADGVVVTDLSDTITFANAAALSLCRAASATDVIGTRFIDTVKITESDSPICLDPPAQAIAMESVVHLPEGCILTALDGSSFDVEDSAAPIHDSRGHVTGAVMVFRDVSTSRAMVKQLAYLAHHDALTGLPNRLLFEDRLAHAFAESARNDLHFAVLYIDVDRFKEINSSFGHAAGDTVLKSVAQRLSRGIRGTDSLCRHGGDEFIVLLTSINRVADVTAIARNLLANIAKPSVVNGNTIYVSASIGIAMYPEDGADAASLLRRADTALRAAKTSGRNNSQFFRPQANAHAREERQIEQSIKSALEIGQFEVLYQPIYNLRNRQIVRAEALLRWRHPTLGDIAPDRFIPIAEQSGYIVPIGRWVRREVLNTLKLLNRSGNNVRPIAINVSAVELRSERFVDEVIFALDEAQLPTHLLELELTETALIHDDRRTRQMLQSLRSFGIHCALDDFGLGFSSLNYLKRFPIDALKIDKSFIAGLSLNASDSHIVRAIVGLAAGFHLNVVAEGIETAEQLSALNLMNCTEGQGFLMCRPIPPAELGSLLAASATQH